MTDSRVRIRRLTLLALLTALCIVLRIVKIPIPNVQPVTDILMIVTLVAGVSYGLPLAVLTMVLSNVVLGFGIWTIPQIVAYTVCILTVALVKLLLPLKRWFWLQLGLCVFLGFEYGVVVSLGMVLVGITQGQVFLAYWLSGLLFDGYHALGNLAFYPLLKLPLTKALDRYLN
ncbi:MAG: ECF transporter S component [Lactobacillus sp.]|jgi:predicted membrane protein|nr:ECF transporter S component [Lactobacillus sp.]